MPSLELKDKTQKTVFDGTEWVYIQNADSPYLVQKITLEDLRGATGFFVGSSMRTEATLIPISPTFPWLCLSYPSVDLTTANYSNEFIDALRARKYTYDEFSTNTSAFSGAWSSNVFTLDDTVANNAMLAELAEDWLYHGSPLSNWRIINDGVTDFKMTTMDVTARTITVDLDGETAAGTSITIYTNRVYRDATKARHFSEAGLATYQAGGGKSGRLFRRDQMQLITGTGFEFPTASTALDTNPNTASGAHFATARADNQRREGDGRSSTRHRMDFNSANSPDARTSATTDGETRAKSSSRYEYIYVGSYTA